MLEIKEQEEPERHYLPMTNWKFDWNMMLYGEDEETGFQLDWNKLIYGEEQMLDFDLKKNEKLMRPEHYEYLFKPPSQRSEMEKFFLKQSGFCNDEDLEEPEEPEDQGAQGAVPIRFIISPELHGDNGASGPVEEPEIISKQQIRF